MRIIDISGWVFDGMWSSCETYRGARITQAPAPADLPSGIDVFCQNFDIGGQTGTYVETDAHVREGAVPVVDLPLQNLVLPAVVVRLEGIGPRRRIGLEDLRRAAPDIRTGDAVILATGYDRHWFGPDFVVNSPFIGKEAAEWILSHSVRCLAGDFPRFDNAEAPEFPWNALWPAPVAGRTPAGGAPLVLAPLAGVYGCGVERATLMALPLKIRDAVSSPTRAVLIVDDDPVAAP